MLVQRRRDTRSALRLIYLMLVDGHYRKYLSRLHERLGEAPLNVVHAFEQIGLELFAQPGDGMFVWARFPILRIRWYSRKPRSATASCSRLARSSVRISSARRGCGSMSPYARTRACSAGCRGRQRTRRREAARGRFHISPGAPFQDD